jgi:hypothetical protein
MTGKAHAAARGREELVPTSVAEHDVALGLLAYPNAEKFGILPDQAEHQA